MAGDPHAELMRLVRHDRDQIGGDKLAELDAIVAVLLFLLHDGASRGGIRHLHVTAPGARAFSLEITFAGTERLSRGPDPRPADLTHLGAFFLRQCPWTVLLGLDLHAGCDAEMQVDFAPERLPVAMTVNESGKDGLAVDNDDPAGGRNRDLATAADGFDAVAFDHNDGI